MPGTRLRMKKSHIARLKLAENVRHRIRLCMLHEGLVEGSVIHCSLKNLADYSSH